MHKRSCGLALRLLAAAPSPGSGHLDWRSAPAAELLHQITGMYTPPLRTCEECWQTAQAGKDIYAVHPRSRVHA